jgi:hypothetical protein
MHKSSKKNTSLEIFYEKFAEGRIARGLLRRDLSIYSIAVTNVKLAGKSQHSFLVSAEDASDRESCEEM